MKFPPFCVTTVGSWPRPVELLAARREREKGRITQEALDRISDRAVLEFLRVQDSAGVELVTDGEQRRDNFYSFVAEKLEGVKLMTLRDMLDIVEDKPGFQRILESLDVPATSIRNPTCTGKIKRREPLAVNELRFLRGHTRKPIKVPLPGPYILTRAMWVKEVTRSVYPTKEALAEDVVRILREEIADLIALGVDFIQLDEPVLTELVFTQGETRTFMCAALAARKDPAEELALAVSLINRVLDGFKADGSLPETPARSSAGSLRDPPPRQGPKFGLHVCRGNWSRNESTLLEGAYHPLVPWFEQLKVDQLVLEWATPRAGELVIIPGKELGLGVVNPRTDECETAANIAARVRSIVDRIEPKKIFLNPDCGFGTFSSRAMNTVEKAKAKLVAMREAAELLRGT